MSVSVWVCFLTLSVVGEWAVHLVKGEVEMMTLLALNCFYTQLSLLEGKKFTGANESTEFEESVLVEHLEMSIMRYTVHMSRWYERKIRVSGNTVTHIVVWFAYVSCT